MLESIGSRPWTSEAFARCHALREVVKSAQEGPIQLARAMLKKSRVTPIDSARDFDLKDLFFSTTDKKGVITGCNETFIQIAGFSPKELLQKPHNVIRHPDMPRCVFQLLWDYLRANKPIGSYVKNISQTGEYYWVFALVMPIEGGFLSVRLKPGSPIFVTIQELYKELVSIERDSPESWRQGMELSGLALTKAIAALGFVSYDSFMAVALKAENEARHGVLSRAMQVVDTPLKAIINDLSKVEKLQQVLSSKREFFRLLGIQISRIALNVSIVAAKLSDAGRALGVISTEVSQVAGKIRDESVVLSDAADTLTARLYDTLFYISSCVLIEEMSASLEASALKNHLIMEEQVARFGDTLDKQLLILTTVYCASLDTCNANVQVLFRTLQSTESSNNSLAKALLNLQLGYVIGKSTSASLKDGGQFTLLLNEVLELSRRSQAELDRIKETVISVGDIVGNWNSKKVFLRLASSQG